MAIQLVKNADLAALDRTIRTGFMDAYNNPSYQPRWPIFATRQPSASAKNIYPQMIDAASVREWSEAGRKINGLVLEGATVQNQLWELSYGIRRIDLDDDMTGAVQAMMSRVRSGAGKYLRHPDRLMGNTIKASGTCLDGLSLFSASHKVNPADPGSDTYSNTTTGALTADNLSSARAAMLALKNPDGDPANENPSVLLVPPALETIARKLTQADIIVYASGVAAPETNVFKGSLTVVVMPQLAAAFDNGSDSAWYLIDATDTEDRALIFQDREAVEMTTRFNPSDPDVFDLDVYTWGTRARYTVAGGNPKKIQRRTG
jgi:phage major head subunit gpT-like protein